MRVLVTGGTGYVGRTVVDVLLQRQHTPVVLSRYRRSQTSAPVEVRQADLNSAELEAALGEIDAVCHLGGLTRARESWQDSANYFRVNVGGTAALLAAAHGAGVQKIVFASTAAVYGAPMEQPMDETLPLDPPHPYAASKVMAEETIRWQVQGGQLGAITLRLFNVAGHQDPDDTRIIPRVLAHLSGHSEKLAINGDGSATRDYVHVRDAAAAVVAAVEAVPPPGELLTVNVGSGAGTSIRDIITAAERVTGRKASVIRNPPAAESPSLVADPSRAMEVLGWKPENSDVMSIMSDAWAATEGIN